MIFVDGREIRVAPVSRNSLLCDCRGFREFCDSVTFPSICDTLH